MSEVINTISAENSGEFKNRKTGLILFGILLLIMGGLCALMLGFSILALNLSQSHGATTPPLSSMIIAYTVYAVLASVFIWLGIGSMTAKRWARALILIGSWITLIVGVFLLVFIATVMPGFFDQLNQSGELEPQVMAIIQTIFYAFFAFIMVILPGIFILFYQSNHVKATCEHLDAHERWTDKCPLPVLALSIIFVSTIPSMLINLAHSAVIPVFGIFLSGIPGTILFLIVIVYLGFLAWGTYHLDIRSWWGALGLNIISSLSYIITLSRQGTMAMYEKMNIPPEELAAMKGLNIFQDSSFIVLIGASAILFTGYLLFVKRYFPALVN